MKPVRAVAALAARTLLVAVVLTFFFSMMAGMYYNSEPRHIRTAIVDEDHSALSRAIIYAVQSSDVFQVAHAPVDYLALQRLMDRGQVDAGVVIPHDLYRDVLNGRPQNILAVLNGTANPIVPKLALGNLNMIVLTIGNQLQAHVPVEELGAVLNSWHQMRPPLSVTSRVFYSPTVNMESSMLPAFMGLAMQVVSLVIITLLLRAGLARARRALPALTSARQLPPAAVAGPVVLAWVMVTTAIALAFYAVMRMFAVPLPPRFWGVVVVIALLVLAMESIALFFSLNVTRGTALIAVYTLIVLPAFLYSGYLVPPEQMPAFSRAVGSWFPLRYYLGALYGVFNRGLSLSDVAGSLNTLFAFAGVFLGLSAVSVAIGTRQRTHLAPASRRGAHPRPERPAYGHRTMTNTLRALVLLALALPPAARAQAGATGSSDSSSAPLTLSQAIAVALANNPLVKARAAGVTAAESRLAQVRSSQVPSVHLTSRYFYSNNLPGMFLQGPNQVPLMSSTGPVPGQYVMVRPMAPYPVESRDVFTTDLDLVYPLYTGGKIATARRNAGMLREAALSDLSDQQRELVYHVTTAFDNILLLTQVIAVNRRALDQFQAHLDLARAAYANGVRSEFDVLTFQSKLQEFQAKLVDLEGKLALATAGLKALLGMPPGAGLSCVGELAYADTVSLADSLGLDSAAVARNDQLNGLRIRRRMLANTRTIAAAELKPTVFVFANYHVYHGMDFPPYDNAWRNGYAAGVGVSMPVFDGNLTQGKLAEIDASGHALDDQLDGLAIKLQMDVTSALITIQNARAALGAEQAHLAVAARAEEIAKVSYANGVITPVELDDAELEVAAVQTAILNYRKDIATAYADLAYLEGGGAPAATGAGGPAER